MKSVPKHTYCSDLVMLKCVHFQQWNLYHKPYAVIHKHLSSKVKKEEASV